MTCDGCSFAGQSTALEHTYVGVRFGEETNLTLCSTRGQLLEKNAKVVVAGERGPAVGWVEKSPMPVFKPCQKTSAKEILRRASAGDLERDQRRQTNEVRARSFCKERARELGLRMKISRVDFNLNGTNGVFYFTADGRVDFRQLVRDLARRFKVRVRMVQLGARDEAKLLGGVGVCGKTLCCSSWMGEFRSISVQMAKRQGVSLNPTKISGQCGRLLCCLKFEDDQYRGSEDTSDDRERGRPTQSGPRGAVQTDPTRVPNRDAATPSKNPVRLRRRQRGSDQAVPSTSPRIAMITPRRLNVLGSQGGI